MAVIDPRAQAESLFWRDQLRQLPTDHPSYETIAGLVVAARERAEAKPVHLPKRVSVIVPVRGNCSGGADEVTTGIRNAVKRELSVQPINSRQSLGSGGENLLRYEVATLEEAERIESVAHRQSSQMNHLDVRVEIVSPVAV